MSEDVVIRRAGPDEAEVLTELTMRSKAHWGYDAAFMEACRPELTVRASRITTGEVWVAVGPEAILGYFDLRFEDGRGEVYACFVDPAAIGEGIGARLWAKAEEIARAGGAREIGVDSDPYAEGFYQKMGAVRVGEAPSGSIPGRMLPRLVKRLE